MASGYARVDSSSETDSSGYSLPEDSHELSDINYTYLAVLGKGKTFSYIIPSFPVLKPELQEVKLQYTDDDGSLCVFDGFARLCDQMDHALPAMARLQQHYENAFFIKVS